MPRKLKTLSIVQSNCSKSSLMMALQLGRNMPAGIIT